MDTNESAGRPAELLLWISRLAAGIVAFRIFRVALAALLFPLELEVREGNSWLQVLVRRAGVSLYDHGQVAISSMVYGPVDPLFKSALAFLSLGAPAHLVVRFLALVIPALLIWLGYELFRPAGKFRLPLATLWMAAVYLAMANLQSYNLLVGRPDLLATVLVITQAALATRLFWSGRLTGWERIVCALLPALTIFTNLRYVPTAGSVWLITLALIARTEKKSVLQLAGLTAACFAGVFALIFFGELGGSWSLYQQHFFAIANTATQGTGAFSLTPADLLASLSRVIPVAGSLIAVLAGLLILRNSAWSWRLRGLAAGLAVLTYLTLAYVLYKNANGGGIFYFAPSALLCGWLLFLFLASKEWISIEKRLTVGLIVYLFMVPMWKQISSQTMILENKRGEAQQFLEKLSVLYNQGELMSEDWHFFKDRLGESIIDNGDGAEMLLNTGLFDDVFKQTTKRYFETVQTGKFKYFFVAGVAAQQTRDFLAKNYEVVERGPAFENWNSIGGCALVINCPTLFQRK